MSYVLHVGPDLVGAARFQPALHECGVAVALHDAPVGDGGLALIRLRREDRHALPVARVAAYVALYASLVVGQMAPHQRVVAAVGVVAEELLAQLALSLGRLGHDEQSARVLVDAVYQPHLRVVGVVGGQVAQVPGDGVDQRTVEVTHARVYHQSCRFVDNHQLVVLVDHVEGDVLGLNRGVEVWTVEPQGDDVARAHLVVALHGTVAYEDEARLGRLLDTVARGVLRVFGEELVDALRHLSPIHLYAQVLIELSVAFGFAVAGVRQQLVVVAIVHEKFFAVVGHLS